MANNIKVAVRVRPFNSREKERNARLCIEMSGQTTEIKELSNSGEEPKKFAFDHSYWSHDGFVEGADGYLSPDGADSIYADQTKVFADVGEGILANAWEGYNCTLFAYGQTGSGKSYSIVGYGKNRGVVPIFCERLFSGIAEKKPGLKKDEELNVKFSMLEIYSEQVRDLLNPKNNKGGGLKVRQHPGKGFYVDNLSESPVGSYEEIDHKMSEGTKNRTIAATNMNATSSRAHTIVALTFTQKTSEDGASMTRTAVVNLVDLAGSERAESTGATGDRLKEGAAINLSLSSLGNVIKALVDAANGKKVIIPFRDSVLTKLLKNALGGNSKTILIAALSPADINYDETLSTLRFADRAKSVKTAAVINESPTEKLIRELREENEKLKAALQQGGVVVQAAPGAGDQGSEVDTEEMERIKQEAEEAIKRNQQEMEKINQNWEERLRSEQEKTAALLAEKEAVEKKKEVVPYMWNLAEDPALTGMVFHFANPGQSRIGNSRSDPPADIILNGLSVQPSHALLESNEDGSTVTLTPKPGAGLKVNGTDIKVETELHHNDRIMFGSNHLYVLHHPKDYQRLVAAPEEGAPPQPPPETPTFETAQQEIVEASGLLSEGLSEEDKLLHEDLLQMVPWVNEVNAISDELRKGKQFSVVLVAPQARGLKDGKTEISVKMTDAETGNDWLWDRNKFINRKSIMKEMYYNYAQGAEWELPQDKDPFWEPPDSKVLIGSVHVFLQSIAYLVDMDENLAITNFKGTEKGNLNVTAIPVDDNGVPIEDDYVEDPYSLIGKSISFKLKVVAARDLPSKYKKTNCRYKFYLDETFTETPEIENTSNPEFGHEKMFQVSPVTRQFIDYLNSQPLIIEVWGSQTVMKAPGGAEGGSRVVSNATIEKVESELRFYKLRSDAAEEKLEEIAALVRKCRAAGKATVPADDIEAILKRDVGVKNGGTLLARSASTGDVDGIQKTKSKMCLIQ